MIVGDVQVPGKSLRCDVCHWEWVSIARELPETCANHECRSRKWNGPKKRIRPTRIEMPKPQKVGVMDDVETYF